MEETVLIVAGEKPAAALAGLVKQGGEGRTLHAPTGGDARRKMAAERFSIAVVNAPLADEMGDAVARDLAEKTDAGVILIVPAETADEIAARVEEAGVLVLPKPVGQGVLRTTLRLARTVSGRVGALRAENARLQARIEELRVVDRAKCALIQYRGLTEEQAHKFIEREAMDGRITRRQVAQELVRMFEG